MPAEAPADVLAAFTECRPRQAPPRSGVRLHASPARNERGEPIFSVWRLEGKEGTEYRLRWSHRGDCAEYDIAVDGRKVRVARSEGLPFEDVVSVLIGPVLGCVLRAQGLTGLHASALAYHGGAIVIMAPKGGGKSTLAAHLCAQGLPLLTDDIAALKESKGRFLLQPGYPRMRQWPSTLSTLPNLDPSALPRVLSLMEKRYVNLRPCGGTSPWQFQSRPQPLLGIYVLETPGPADTSPCVHAIRATDALVALVRNTYADYMLDRAGRARDFELLGEVAGKIPLRLVRRPLGLQSVRPVCRSILEDAKMLRRVALKLTHARVG